MKRIIAAIMVLVSVLTLSGCKGGTNYWDGLTKQGAKEYIQNALQEKYGEEFIVKKHILEVEHGIHLQISLQIVRQNPMKI